MTMLSPLNTKLPKSKVRDDLSKTPTHRTVIPPGGFNTKGSMMLNQEIMKHKLANVQTSQRMNVQIIEHNSLMDEKHNISDFSNNL